MGVMKADARSLDDSTCKLQRIAGVWPQKARLVSPEILSTIF